MLVFLFVCYIYCVFSSFRQFEERELRSQQERAKKRLEFENQKFRLQNQIEFERSRDTIGTNNRSKTVFFLLKSVTSDINHQNPFTVIKHTKEIKQAI
mgnify:CR=1 FL=1